MGFVNVVIGGDFCPINRSIPILQKGDVESLFGDFLPHFRGNDLSIVNLECPLIKEPSPIIKTGQILGVDSSCIRGLANLGLGLANLSNNHILDHGEAGLENTLKLLQENNIATVGAGNNLATARRPFVREIGSFRLGVMGVAAHEFSIATTNSWGANPLDLRLVIPDLIRLREEVDYLIILIHAGIEGYPYPSPGLRATCRLLVDLGARCIVCQHSHRAGCFESYNNGLIVYGQGNLLFDIMPPLEKDFYRGFLVQLCICEDTKSHSFDIIPFVQSEKLPGLHRMERNEEEKFVEALHQRSAQLGIDGFIERQWVKFCKKMESTYLSKIFFHNRVLRRVSRTLGLHRLFLNHEQKLLLLNLIRCEDHREVMETILNF